MNFTSHHTGGKPTEVHPVLNKMPTKKSKRGQNTPSSGEVLESLGDDYIAIFLCCYIAM